MWCWKSINNKYSVLCSTMIYWLYPSLMSITFSLTSNTSFMCFLAISLINREFLLQFSDEFFGLDILFCSKDVKCNIWFLVEQTYYPISAMLVGGGFLGCRLLNCLEHLRNLQGGGGSGVKIVELPWTS